MTDYITDIIIRLRNANQTNKVTVTFPYSSLGMAIAETLNKNGYIGAISRKGKRARSIEATLIYDKDLPKISGVNRLSKQSRRVYNGAKDIKSVMNGYGKVIVSTPKGVMTGDEAKRAKVGGELLFEIW